MEGVEINTIDRYQGRDKSVIIISFAQQFYDTSEENTSDKNFDKHKNSILNDVRRLKGTHGETQF